MRAFLWFSILCLTMTACGGGGVPNGAPAIAEPTATFAETTEPIAALGLEGRLLYTQGEAGLLQLDLTTGEVSVLWSPPEGGTVEGVDVSPDGQVAAIAYSPPREAGSSPVPRSRLYLLDTQSGELDPVLEGPGENEDFFDPLWSADGEWLYFTRSAAVERQDRPDDVVLNVERVHVQEGGPEIVIENAEGYSISADGNRAVYQAFDPETFARTLMAAGPDGSSPRRILAGADFSQVASPTISPDGSTIAFSGAVTDQGGPPSSTDKSLLARFLGVNEALAHGLPADIFSIPFEGGEPRRHTTWGTDAPVPAWSPGSGELAALRPGGIFLIRDGDPRFLVSADGHGEMDWAP